VSYPELSVVGSCSDSDRERLDHGCPGQSPVDSEIERLSLAITTAAHDIRQQLQALLTTIDIALTTIHTSTPAEPLLKQARTQGVRLVRYLEHLSLENRSPPMKQFLAVRELLDELQEGWAEEADRRRLALSVLVPDAWVISDRRLLSVILDNVVLNALHHTLVGGVRIDSAVQDGQLIISVQDTGPGIPATLLRHANHRGRRTRSGGLGLGLSIVRRTAALLGHQLIITTSHASGTRVSVHLPLGAVREGQTT
jgi:two-component system, sensor histidine kinase